MNSRPPKENKEDVPGKSVRQVLTTCSAAAYCRGAETETAQLAPDGLAASATDQRPMLRPSAPPAVYAPHRRPALHPGPLRTCQPACQPACHPACPRLSTAFPTGRCQRWPICRWSASILTRLHGDQLSTDAGLDYQVGYTPLPVAPCSGYSTSYSGCSSCGAMRLFVMRLFVMRDELWRLSSCSAGVSSTYVTSGGCSSCTSKRSAMYGTPIPAPATIGWPSTAPSLPSEAPARTFAPGSPAAPISPGAAGATNGSPPSAGASYRVPAAGEGSRASPRRGFRRAAGSRRPAT